MNIYEACPEVENGGFLLYIPHINDRLAHWREAPMPLPLGEVARRNAGTERVFAEHFPSQSRLWRDSSPIGRAVTP